MKPVAILHLKCLFLFCWLPASLSAQNSFSELVEKGKAEFKKEYAEQDYARAAAYLEQAIALQPGNAEAHYYLGYAYDRVNSKDGSEINGTKLALAIKSSEEFEMVNKLEPLYKGQYEILDPYTKLTAIWGSLAYCYLYQGKNDSVKWALQEGRKRGGFSDFSIEAAKNALLPIRKNSLLFSYGDFPTFSLLYVQQIENVRTDVLVMDQSLLFANWFVEMLYGKNLVKHQLDYEYIAQTDYIPWTDTIVTIPISGTAKSFSWKMAPTLSEAYIGKGSMVLLDILTSNKFERETYFMNGGKEEDIGIADHYSNLVSSYHLNVRETAFSDLEAIQRSLPVISKANKNSKTEMQYVDILGNNALRIIVKTVDNNQRKEAQQMLSVYDRYVPVSDFTSKPEVSAWLKELREK